VCVPLSLSRPRSVSPLPSYGHCLCLPLSGVFSSLPCHHRENTAVSRETCACVSCVSSVGGGVLSR
jgi:hypothetical protein